MAARAITPRVTAITGHVQTCGTACTGDCCGYDRDQDSRWDTVAGSDYFSPEPATAGEPPCKR